LHLHAFLLTLGQVRSPNISGLTAAKTKVGTTLANVDWLHGPAESLLTITNLLIGRTIRTLHPCMFSLSMLHSLRKCDLSVVSSVK